MSNIIDCIAAEIVYHRSCFSKFFLPQKNMETATPTPTYIVTAMEEIYSYIEQTQECQFLLDELIDQITG